MCSVPVSEEEEKWKPVAVVRDVDHIIVLGSTNMSIHSLFLPEKYDGEAFVSDLNDWHPNIQR